MLSLQILESPGGNSDEKNDSSSDSNTTASSMRSTFSVDVLLDAETESKRESLWDFILSPGGEEADSLSIPQREEMSLRVATDGPQYHDGWFDLPLNRQDSLEKETIEKENQGNPSSHCNENKDLDVSIPFVGELNLGSDFAECKQYFSP